MATLSLRGVEKAYGPVRVLDRIDLEVNNGEYIVLVGPSGCGKSTLLRCIAGLEEITSGELQIDGRRMNEVAPRDRDIAMVFQSYALYPHLTVRENMAFPLKIRHLPPAEIDAAITAAASQLELGALLDRKPSQLSGGQRQRVAMGRAIVRRPKVFLFDEPLSNLDATLRHQMRLELKRLHRALQATIIHVTHDQIEALTLADRIVVLHRGVVQQIGTPRELYERPANTFVATFVGSPAMNLIRVAPRGGEILVEGSSLAIGGAASAAAADEPFLLGFRPGDTALVEDPSSDAVVEAIEPLGGECLVHVTIGKGSLPSLVAQLREPISLRMGDRVVVVPSVVHCFDVQSHKRLPDRPQSGHEQAIDEQHVKRHRAE